MLFLLCGGLANYMKVQAILKKKHNDKTGKSEWALVSRKSGRVLRWFGAQHPSEERVKKEERRIQYFKHHGSVDSVRFPAIARVLAAHDDLLSAQEGDELEIPAGELSRYSTHQGAWNNPQEMKELEDSLKDLGWEGTDPAIFSRSKQMLLNGNHRLALVLKMFGPNYMVPVRVEANAFTPPTKAEIVEVLRKHPLIKLKEKVKRAFLVGSFAAGKNHDESDVDILLEVEPHPDQSALQLAEAYRRPLQQYFVTHNIRGKDDSVHPQWAGRRVDLYFTYDADQEDDRPKIELE
jgi:predicted nucleotidyltransferase